MSFLVFVSNPTSKLFRSLHLRFDRSAFFISTNPLSINPLSCPSLISCSSPLGVLARTAEQRDFAVGECDARLERPHLAALAFDASAHHRQSSAAGSALQRSAPASASGSQIGHRAIATTFSVGEVQLTSKRKQKSKIAFTRCLIQSDQSQV